MVYSLQCSAAGWTYRIETEERSVTSTSTSWSRPHAAVNLHFPIFRLLHTRSNTLATTRTQCGHVALLRCFTERYTCTSVDSSLCRLFRRFVSEDLSSMLVLNCSTQRRTESQKEIDKNCLLSLHHSDWLASNCTPLHVIAPSTFNIPQWRTSLSLCECKRGNLYNPFLPRNGFVHFPYNISFSVLFD